MKKLLSVFVSLLLVLSMTTLVFAEEGSAESGDGIEGIKSEIRTELRGETGVQVKGEMRERMDAHGMVRSEAKQRVEARGLDLALQRCKESGRDENKCAEVLERVMMMQKEHKERVNALMQEAGFRKFQHGRAREVAKNRHEEMRARFDKHNKEAMELREKIKDGRSKIQDIRTLFEECEANPTEECKTKLGDRITALKEYIDNAGDLAEAEIDKLKAKLESSEDLTDEEEAAIEQRLETVTGELEIAEDKVEALNAESTRAEVKEAVEMFRGAFGRAKHSIKGEVEGLVHARIGGIVVKSTHLRDRLDDVMQRLAEKGTDTTSLESLVAEFDEHLNLAAEKYEEAQTKFKEARESKNEETRKTAIDLVQNSKEHLKEAHEILKKIFRELKGHGEESAVVAAVNVEAAASAQTNVVTTDSNGEIEEESEDKDDENEESEDDDDDDEEED
ncbi:hypothetical protein HYT58_02750 [Candidatus Woesearchaeota archaeon]|nr:hypothetical protein [Candidatus Woesearchaeota archaeon]